LNFVDGISKNTETSKLTKIRPVETELFLADKETDGRTDMTKLIVAFSNFANAPKIICC